VHFINQLRFSLTNRTSSADDHYRLAFGIRSFERLLLDQFTLGKLSGTTHTCLGQEVVQVGVTAALDRERDCVFSNHRGHGHFLAYCGDLTGLLAEIMGNSDGICGGRGGSQHLQHHNFYSNGVLGGTVGNATGVALAEKLRGSGAITVVWMGDGAFGEGLVYEAMNIAALWKLPIVFLAECNGIAQATPTTMQMAGDVAGRCAAFGIGIKEVTGDDIDEVIAIAAEVFDATRADQLPRCIVSRAVRLGPHSKGDDTRAREVMTAAWAKDPLQLLRGRVSDAAVVSIEDDVGGLIAAALARVGESAGP
jgi:TPP-dependent pyruvate/acetoin dehydrogenase alpha subunit